MTAALNNRSLRRVREQRHLDIAEVAEFANISRARLAEFEEGSRRPSRKQLEKLAQTYGISLYSLFGDAIPNTPEALPDFRKQTPSPAVLTPRGLRAIFNSERISRFAKQLSLEIGYDAPQWSSAVTPVRPNREGADFLRATFDDWFAKCGPQGSTACRTTSGLGN